MLHFLLTSAVAVAAVYGQSVLWNVASDFADRCLKIGQNQGTILRLDPAE